MMTMYNPPHPGRIVKKAMIESTGLSVTEAARILGVQRVTLSKIINEQAGISPEMAIRLSIALGTSSEMWLTMQIHYSLWQAQKKQKTIKKEVTIINTSTQSQSSA